MGVAATGPEIGLETPTNAERIPGSLSSARSCRVLLAGVAAFVLAPLPALAADVAVLMSAKVAPYEQALRGFGQTSQHQIVARYDMNADQKRGRRMVREIDSKLKPDLLLVIGLWALEGRVAPRNLTSRRSQNRA